MKRLMKYERVKYKQYNHVILNDAGIPDLMKVITDVKNRMNNFLNKKNNLEPAKTQNIADVIEEKNIVEESNSSHSENDKNGLMNI